MGFFNSDSLNKAIETEEKTIKLYSFVVADVLRAFVLIAKKGEKCGSKLRSLLRNKFRYD